MKTITIKNPYAYLIAKGIKDVENRTWKTNEPTYLIRFKNGKETLTKRYEQVTSHEVTKEKYQVGTRRHAPLYFVMKIYQMEQAKSVVCFLLYNEKAKTCIAVPESECRKLN